MMDTGAPDADHGEYRKLFLALQKRFVGSFGLKFSVIKSFCCFLHRGRGVLLGVAIDYDISSFVPYCCFMSTIKNVPRKS